MDSKFLNASWIWHPQWSESDPHTAGGFVHFRKSITIAEKPAGAMVIQMSADTRYKLYVNSQLIAFGPVKGDQHMWFYDEVDIAPYLQRGVNIVAVRVLRFYHATLFATSFPRLTCPGLVIRQHTNLEGGNTIATDDSWETALDNSTRLPFDIVEDDFLHVYEDVDSSKSDQLRWTAAKILEFPNSHGLTAPWKLSPRLIPYPRLSQGYFKRLHNIRSVISNTELERMLLSRNRSERHPVLLKAGSSHHIEIEADHLVTALLSFRFGRPSTSGATIHIKYSECYEDDPRSVPYLRKKGDRLDSSKRLFGPQDTYRFGGKIASDASNMPHYDHKDPEEEVFSPFHFRTLRLITVDIHVSEQSDLVWSGIDMTLQNYALDTHASLTTTDAHYSELYDAIWSTSIRTLRNCLHDTYEDCPFYEQLQYAMDTRSSILFTYCVSNDDRLARQAIIQLNNTYQPSIGLTASRAPAHSLQVIPHFSLYWVCMIADHYRYFGDLDFVRQFCHTCDGVLETFRRRTDPDLGLVRFDPQSPHWDFVDWAHEWQPLGIPPAGARTGFLSYTSMLYAYTLEAASTFVRAIGRPALADEYIQRAKSLVISLQTHCFDGHHFTDGLVHGSDLHQDYSQQTQIWAVLSGAASGDLASSVLEHPLNPNTETSESTARPSKNFVRASTAMSFYALRALSKSNSRLYERFFHEFWRPWRLQLSNNLSTWEEDPVSQRSDCHAWACAALYEFTMEVAGLQPGGPGWAELSFRPRLALFRDFAASVPYGGTRCPGVASVEWRTLGGEGQTGEKTVEVVLELRSKDGSPDHSRERREQVSVDIQVSNAEVQLVEELQREQHVRVMKWIVRIV